MDDGTGRVAGMVACVTGAARGIGRAAATLLAREGATVIATDLGSNADGLLEDMAKSGGSASYHRLDVTLEGDWQDLVQTIARDFGRLDILVNNAGIGLSSPVTEMTLDAWKTQMSVNVDGTFLGVKHCLPLMRATGGGSIINVSSIAGIKASPNVSGYCASKAAVRYFTKSVALECAAMKDGVRVNSIHPGVVETAIWDTLIGTDVHPASNRPRSSTIQQFTAQAVPLGRAGRLDEIASGILWLASGESSYVTGTELVIDGGRSIA